MSIVILLAVGLGVGWLANWLANRFVGESRFGLFGDLIAGLVGACIAGLAVPRLLPAVLGATSPTAIAITLLGASLLVLLVRIASGESWRFAQKDPVLPLSENVRMRLAAERGLSVVDASSLRMMQERGQYAGRTVTYFQVFDPVRAKALGADLRRVDTMDPRSFLHSGFIEQDGAIVLNAPPREPIVRATAPGT